MYKKSMSVVFRVLFNFNYIEDFMASNFGDVADTPTLGWTGELHYIYLNNHGHMITETHNFPIIYQLIT